jgi:hypothetical protein
LEDSSQVVERMIYDLPYREQREKYIKDNFVARTWDDVGRDFLEALQHVTRRSDLPHAYLPKLDPGEFFRPAVLSGQSGQLDVTYLTRPLRLMLGGDWHAPDGLGVRLKGRSGRVLLATRYSTSERVVVTVEILGGRGCVGKRIELRGAPAATGGSPETQCGDEKAAMSTVIMSDEKQNITISTVTNSVGVIELSVKLDEPIKYAGRNFMKMRSENITLTSINYMGVGVGVVDGDDIACAK